MHNCKSYGLRDFKGFAKAFLRVKNGNHATMEGDVLSASKLTKFKPLDKVGWVPNFGGAAKNSDERQLWAGGRCKRVGLNICGVRCAPEARLLQARRMAIIG